jgi:hypothetical protein
MDIKSGKFVNSKWTRAFFELNLGVSRNSLYSIWGREFLNLLETLHISLILLFNNPVVQWPAVYKRIGSIFFLRFDVA